MHYLGVCVVCCVGVLVQWSLLDKYHMKLFSLVENGAGFHARRTVGLDLLSVAETTLSSC